MADSLKTRVGRVIAGGVHALIDRLEDQAPEAVMEQSLREADVVINDVRHELGQVSANRHLAQQQHASLNSQHTKLAELGPRTTAMRAAPSLASSQGLPARRSLSMSRALCRTRTTSIPSGRGT